MKPGGSLPTDQPVASLLNSPLDVCLTCQSGGSCAHDGLTISRSIFALTVTSVNAICSTISPLSLMRLAFSRSPVPASAQNLCP